MGLSLRISKINANISNPCPPENKHSFATGFPSQTVSSLLCFES